MKLFDNIKAGIGNWAKRSDYVDAWNTGQPVSNIFGHRRNILGAGMTEARSLAIPAVFACVRAIVDGIASMPIELVQDMPDGSTRKAKEKDEYWLFADRPNPEDTTREFIESYLISLIQDGNGYAHTWRNNRGRCTEIKYLEPGLVSVGRVRGQLVYRAYDATEGTPLTLFQGDSMWHCKRFRRDTWSGKGLSVLEYHRETMGLSLTQQEFTASMYGEGTVPQGILTAQADLESAQIKKISKQWQSSWAGIKNVGKTPVLPLGLEYKSISMKPADAAMVEVGGYTERQVAQIYGVGLYMLYNFKDIKFSTNEEQQIDHVTNCLRPWIETIEDSLTANVLTTVDRRAGYRYEVDEEAFYRGAKKDMHETFAVDIVNGIKSRNEVRIEIGLPPVEGGDDLLLPANSVTQKEKNMQIEASEKALEDPQVEAAEGAADPQQEDDQAALDQKAQANGGSKPKQKGVSNNPAGSLKKRSKAEEALFGNVWDALDRVASKEVKVAQRGGNVKEALGDHEGYFKKVMGSSVFYAFRGLCVHFDQDIRFHSFLNREAAKRTPDLEIADTFEWQRRHDKEKQRFIDALELAITSENSTHG